ncbi:MMPL family transporter [Methylacidimicrobium sp. B4]|uniref:MMPL family transporter n=1 Tax=Methylacidimicrobium sp. B4 TaxID=2796139 RepID=UPI001A8E22D3|nr:MMPL family transporter [Methylacidimicrobium sp. B4]QSR84337.1 MMPL family transporter [Methylacidimicrobium sp. B4]
MKRFLQWLLVRLVRLAVAWPGLVLSVAIVATGFSAWVVVTRLRVINDTNALIRADSPIHRNYLAYRQEFRVAEEYLVTIRSPDPETNKRAAQALGEQLKELAPLVRDVTYRFDFSSLEKRALLFLELDELAKIETEVDGYVKALAAQPKMKLNIASVLSQANQKFEASYLRKRENWTEFKPFIGRFVSMLNAMADAVAQSPAPAAAAPATSNGGKQPGHPPEDDLARLQAGDIQKLIADHEYISYEDGHLFLVTAAPGPDALDGAGRTEAVHKIREILKYLGADYPEVSFALTGEPVLDEDQLEQSSTDSLHAAELAFGLVALLFLLSYRELRRPGLGLLVLVMALFWSLAFGILVIGHLNIISQAFVAMVLGMGIDFSIQVMGRYEEELAHGRSVAEALEITAAHTGVAVVTGGSTTAVAFFTMCFNDFVGLREFGIIAGSGILFCLAGSLLVLPAAYAWIDRKKAVGHLREAALRSHWSSPSWLHRTLFCAPRTILAAALLASAGAAWLAPRVGFDYNLLDLQDPTLESVREEEALVNSPARAFLFGLSIADNEEQAAKRIRAFGALPTVSEVHSLSSVLPERQEEKQAVVRRIVRRVQSIPLDREPPPFDGQQVRMAVGELLAKSREGLTAAKRYVALAQQARDAVEVFGMLIPALERLEGAIANLPPEELDSRLRMANQRVFGSMQSGLSWLRAQDTSRGVSVSDLPSEIAHRFLSPHGKILIEVLPKENVWNRDADVRFVRDLRTVDPNVTGTPVQNYEYIELLRSSYVQAAEWAFAAIVILIAIRFQHLGYSVLAILPLGMAVLWTLGTMVLFHVPFNPANIITLPLAIGAGVAYGIYTVDRFCESGNAALFSSSTGKAILLSGLTAVIGFGSLMISSYRGLFGLGLLMTLSIGFCLIASLIVLPQLFWLVCRRREAKGQTPAAAPPEISRAPGGDLQVLPEEARARNGRI